jgi:hypothetical protein
VIWSNAFFPVVYYLFDHIFQRGERVRLVEETLYAMGKAKGRCSACLFFFQLHIAGLIPYGEALPKKKPGNRLAFLYFPWSA